ncbi:hypothetical protein GCM10011321_12930 [Youhaiella tibetensis]|uniref:Uncharacterized protein n=1 Tax=Paradevosia tibetensis TaxID=1447062 RepID=A0A5B9DQD1_9HYPH|nr:hypothetical protein [Youhaiella tibetensis]AKR55438.1 hypothetical protein XM25_06380 [Devosia sp. H5989]QEE20574.1 hypothetical protein FNA67_10495 [Youhaiella tibetensis]GGF22919.1 hypothetical protein GCM10011321_12930 [Youhaiella tibetensis]
MDRRKLTSAALFFTIFGTLLFLPPLVLLFNLRVRLFGVPAEVVYLFVVWLCLVLGTAFFAYRLPHEGEQKPEDAG